MTEPTCNTCKFWKPIDETPNAGKCKWGPPIWLPAARPGAGSRSAWPTTPAGEFCFRWESYLPAVKKPEPPESPPTSAAPQPPNDSGTSAADFGGTAFLTDADRAEIEWRKNRSAVKPEPTPAPLEHKSTLAPAAEFPPDSSVIHVPAGVLTDPTGKVFDNQLGKLHKAKEGKEKK